MTANQKKLAFILGISHRMGTNSALTPAKMIYLLLITETQPEKIEIL